MTEKLPKNWRRERDDLALVLHDELAALQALLAAGVGAENFELTNKVDAVNKAAVTLNRLAMAYAFARAMAH